MWFIGGRGFPLSQRSLLYNIIWLFFKNFKFTIVPYGETPNLYLEHERLKSEAGWNLRLVVTSGTYMA